MAKLLAPSPRRSQSRLPLLEGAPTLRQKVLRVSLYLVLGLVALYYLAPLYVMLTTSFKSLNEIRDGSLLALPRVVTFEPWSIAWSDACISVSCSGIQPYFWNSVAMTVPAVLISTFVGALNGYALTKWRFPGADWVFSAMLFGCFIPFQVVLLPLAQTIGSLGLAGTTVGLVLVHVVYGIPFTTLFFRNFYVGVSDELVKAATLEGAGFFTIFWRIMLPISMPIVMVSMIWEFTNIWNDFLFGASLAAGGGQPMTVALNNLVNTSTGVKQYNVDMAAAILTGAPTLLVYIVVGRFFVRGLTSGSVKG